MTPIDDVSRTPETPARQVRVFISSTFRDMHAERDHLVTVVFPELRERVEQLGLEFFDVDLRWGVPARDVNGETANSWEYCRQWIDRVEPLFVCILGQRYGWVPSADQFRDEEDRRRQASEARSITDLEVRHAVLDSRRKRRSYFYLRETLVPRLQPDAPEADQIIHDEFVDPPEAAGRLDVLKTEIRGCGRPVRPYSCRWTGRTFTGLDAFGQTVLEDLWSGVLRDSRYVSPEIWRQVLSANPESDPRYTDESQSVPRELWERIVKLAKPAPATPLDAERHQMDAFAATRLRWFQGRARDLQQLTDFVESNSPDAPRLAVVAAAPGQGKSALLARVHEALKSAPHLVITHFVGVTERPATAYALVQRLLDELDRSGIDWASDRPAEGEEPKRDFNSLCLRLARRLGDYAGDRRVVFLLDALNQLSDGHDLHWLPSRLGPHVRVIVSCLEDSGWGPYDPAIHVLHAMTQRRPAPLRVLLGPLTDDDVRATTVAYLHEYCHELDREHLDALCTIEQAHNPLYLMVVLNELRTLGGNDLNRLVPAFIASMPQVHPDTVSLFRWVLQRLEVFNEGATDAVRWWCLYLLHGRVGLASRELAELLARKLGEGGAPAALRIERGLRRYLQRRGPQLDFFHGQLRRAALELYDQQAEPCSVHEDLADHFTTRAQGRDPQRAWETDDVRGFAECVFHTVWAGRHERARGLLCDFRFLLHKTRVGLLEGVFEDVGLFHQVVPAAMALDLEPWSAFLREHAHVLRRGNETWPAHKILLQLAVEQADDSPITSAAEQWLSEGRCDWLWFRRVPRPPHAHRTSCVATLEGHTSSVEGALALGDGRLLSWSPDKTLRVWNGQSGACLATLDGHTAVVWGALELTDGRLLSWSEDHTLRVWDGHSGVCLTTLQGHLSGVKGALELADGRLVSWSEDHTLRAWDGHSGVCLAVLEGHAESVWGALALADGRLLSWSSSTTLRVWDGQSGACVATLEGHTREVAGALELADGRLVSWSADATVRVWDAQSGACLVTLAGHTGAVMEAQAAADGRLLSWSWDNTLRLWDGQSGACLVTYAGHTGTVMGAMALADGRLLSWSWDNTLRLWDGQSGVCLAILAGHAGPVRGALALADERLVSWSRDDKALWLWDGQTGDCLRTLTGHTGGIWGTLAIANDRLLSWSNDGTLRLWNARSGASLVPRDGHKDGVDGVLLSANGRLLSWSQEDTLRLWDAQSGACLAMLEGHTDWVKGALALADGRLLSWSWDHTLRLWDGQSGASLVTLAGHTDHIRGVLALTNGRLVSWSDDKSLRLWAEERGTWVTLLGHTDGVEGALALTDGRLLSWSLENALRVWDGRSGVCLATLTGHTNWIKGALALPDGRLLSWAWDMTLRLWDGQRGTCLTTLAGHTDQVQGALGLADGRLLSWSWDRTLRLWDGRSGVCLRTLSGHTSSVEGALAWADGRLLSWSGDHTMRLWDDRSGDCVEVATEEAACERHPEWLLARENVRSPAVVCDECFADAHDRVARLRHGSSGAPVAVWNAESNAEARCLLADGTAVVTQDNGQVCVLKLHNGQRRFSLAEAGALLAHQRKNPRATPPFLAPDSQRASMD